MRKLMLFLLFLTASVFAFGQADSVVVQAVDVNPEVVDGIVGIIQALVKELPWWVTPLALILLFVSEALPKLNVKPKGILEAIILYLGAIADKLTKKK